VLPQELAVLDLVATAVESKGQGNCRTLLRALEGWLGPELGVARLVAVCPADVSDRDPIAERSRNVITQLTAVGAAAAAAVLMSASMDSGSMHVYHCCECSIHAVCCQVQDPHNIQLWQQKFGFKKLDGRGLKALQSSVPALNFYEESTMLSKPLKQPRSSSKKQPSNGADKHSAQAQGKEQQLRESGLTVEPLKA
jgi:hypothetical protein